VRRLRRLSALAPDLMTSFAFVLGVCPSISQPAGKWAASVGTAIVGGMLFSTVLNSSLFQCLRYCKDSGFVLSERKQNQRASGIA